jgi:hypothetical protein
VSDSGCRESLLCFVSVTFDIAESLDKKACLFLLFVCFFVLLFLCLLFGLFHKPLCFFHRFTCGQAPRDDQMFEVFKFNIA